jgi:hypothetical protein
LSVRCRRTIVLISPSIVALDFEGHGFAFFGEDFTIRQDIQSSIGFVYTHGLDPGCDPCLVGQTWDPSFSNDEVFLGTGPAEFGGVTYGSLAYFSTLDFVATPVTFPNTNVDGFYMTTPFSFTGTLRAMSGDQLAFGGTFVGTGTARRFFDRFERWEVWRRRKHAGVRVRRSGNADARARLVAAGGNRNRRRRRAAAVSKGVATRIRLFHETFQRL